MKAPMLAALLWACAAWPGLACAAPAPLDDAQLATVRGADGINFAMRLELNQPGPNGVPVDSRLYIAHEVGGKTTYTVFRNVSGVVQMFGLSLSAETGPGGQQYMAVGLPMMTRFTNFGFESLSVQSDPQAPVTDSLGRFSLDGEMRMTGQLRLWSH